MGYLIGAGIMIAGGVIAGPGVNAERKSLEDLATPLSAVKATPAASLATEVKPDRNRLHRRGLASGFVLVTRLLVCTDDRLFGAALEALLNEQPDFTVLAEAGLSNSVAEIVHRLAPDVVLVAAEQKGIDAIKAFADATRVVVLTDGSASKVAQALASGARAVLNSRPSETELFTVMRLIASSAVVVAPISVGELVRTPVTLLSPEDPPLLTALTDRERDVLRLIAHGMSNNEVARKLSISAATVRSHVHHLLNKFGVQGRAQAVAVAYQNGLVDLLDQEVRRRTTRDEHRKIE